MSRRIGFGLGVSAGILAIGVMFMLRYALGVPAAPELIQDTIVQLFPGEVSSFIVDRLQASAKLILFASIIPVQLGVLGLIGILTTRPSETAATTNPLRRMWDFPLTWGIVWWVLVVGVLFPNAGLGYFGSWTSNGGVITALASLAPPMTFAIGLMLGRVLTEQYLAGSHRQTEASGQLLVGRRRFLGLSLAAIVGAATAGSLTRTLVGGGESVRAPIVVPPEAARLSVPPTPTPTVVGHPGTPGVPASSIPVRSPTPTSTPLLSTIVNPAEVPGMPDEVTSNEDFYTVSKNVIDPKVSVNRWSLKVEGLVERPFELTYDELRALPASSQFTTLTCISNPVGGPLISNAKWTGVRLIDLLEQGGLLPGVRDIALFAAEGYSDSITLEKALEPTTLVAYAMNDELLPSSHGAPVRLVVPGIFGMKNVKWLTVIEATNEDFKGFWERRGWSDIAIIKTMSRIDVPNSKIIAPGRNAIGGVAYAGTRGVPKVEWSADGGDTWKEAVVRPPVSPLSWVLWADEWTPSASGAIRLRVRATDATGAVQTARIAEPFPNGSTGHHEVLSRLL